MEKTEEISRLRRRRVAAALRTTCLRSSCGIAAGNEADAVEEPIFVPRRRDDQYRNEEITFRRRPQPSHRPSLPSQHRYLCAERRRTGAYGPRPPPAPPGACGMRRRRPETQKGRVPRSEEKKKKLSSYSFATSSSGGGGDDDETDWTSLFSSLSFSSGSPELYYSSSCHCSRRRKKKKKNCPARRHRRSRGEEADGEERGRRSRLADGLRPRRHRRSRREEADGEGSGRGSSSEDGFRPLVSVSVSSSPSSSSLAAAAAELQAEEEKMGFAVEVKQSSDPREDFRSSMVEMIMEKQVFGGGEQEELLLRYLWLNSPRHHAVILEVFSDIRETLFGYHR